MAFIPQHLRGNLGASILGLIISGAFLAFWAAAIIGWIWNIIKIINVFDMYHITGEVVVRIIGIFVAPIGCIYGWF
jgi:hypothetical protein